MLADPLILPSLIPPNASIIIYRLHQAPPWPPIAHLTRRERFLVAVRPSTPVGDSNSEHPTLSMRRGKQSLFPRVMTANSRSKSQVPVIDRHRRLFFGLDRGSTVDPPRANVPLNFQRFPVPGLGS